MPTLQVIHLSNTLWLPCLETDVYVLRNHEFITVCGNPSIAAPLPLT